MQYRLTPTIKLRQTEKWSKKNNIFYMIQDFSSGYITIESDEYKNFDISKPPKIFNSIVDINLSDNDGVEFKSKDKNLTKKIQTIFEESFDTGLEEEGWERDPDSVIYEFIGGIKINALASQDAQA